MPRLSHRLLQLCTMQIKSSIVVIPVGLFKFKVGPTDRDGKAKGKGIAKGDFILHGSRKRHHIHALLKRTSKFLKIFY